MKAENINPIWFANYTNEESAQRTTEVKTCYSLKDARKFMEYRFGYITRWGEKTELYEYCGGFTPSAQEELHIKSLINA